MDWLSHSFLWSYAWSFFFSVRLSKLAAKPTIDWISLDMWKSQTKKRTWIDNICEMQASVNARAHAQNDESASIKENTASVERARAAASLARRWLKNRSRAETGGRRAMERPAAGRSASSWPGPRWRMRSRQFTVHERTAAGLVSQSGRWSVVSAGAVLRSILGWTTDVFPPASSSSSSVHVQHQQLQQQYKLYIDCQLFCNTDRYDSEIRSLLYHNIWWEYQGMKKN